MYELYLCIFQAVPHMSLTLKFGAVPAAYVDKTAGVLPTLDLLSRYVQCACVFSVVFVCFFVCACACFKCVKFYIRLPPPPCGLEKIWV